MMSNIQVSLVIPLLNEDESLTELTEWIDKSLTAAGLTYEIVYVDDGSTDNSWSMIQELKKRFDQIKGIRFTRNYGKSAGLNAGFAEAGGEVVITMDADLQDSPDEVPELYRMITEEGYDLVSGWKKKRYDPLSKTIPTKLYNAVTRMMSGIKLNDFNCGLKAYKADVIKTVQVYGEMHRYIPVMAKWAGFKNIGEKVVEHRARKYGSSKFGLNRFINGPLDLISIIFVSKFRKKPMHFFGSWGIIAFMLGFGLFMWLGGEVFYAKTWGSGEVRELTENPSFFLALVSLILGVQLFLAGFVGEMVQLNNREHDYLVKETLD